MTLKKKEAGDHLPNPNWNRVEGVKGNKLFVRTGEKVGKGKEESFWPFRNWGVGGGGDGLFHGTHASLPGGYCRSKCCR